MAQPDFPTLSQLPEQEGFRREPAYDSVLRPEFEAGIETARARHTNVPWQWSFCYRGLSNTDKETILTFWRDTCTCGAVVFHWVDLTNNTAYFVRFAAPPRCTLEPDGTGTWRVDLQIRQAIGSYT